MSDGELIDVRVTDTAMASTAHIKATDYSAAQILGAISAAMTADDMPAVNDLMHMLAVVDPHAAESIASAVQIARLIGSTGEMQ